MEGHYHKVNIIVLNILRAQGYEPIIHGIFGDDAILVEVNAPINPFVVAQMRITPPIMDSNP